MIWRVEIQDKQTGTWGLLGRHPSEVEANQQVTDYLERYPDAQLRVREEADEGTP